MLSTPIKTYQLLFGIVLLEIICHTLFINIGLEEFISMSYLFAGIAIGIMPFLKTKDQSIKWVNQIFDFKLITPIAFSLFLTTIVFAIIKSYLDFQSHPLDYTQADMLPIIQIMCNRLINGEAVYAIIPEIWDGMTPIYLPAMWFPYIPSVLFDFDPRWISLIALFASAGLVVSLAKNHLSKQLKALVYLSISTLLLGIMIGDFSLIRHTEEPVVIFYYTLLGYAILNQNKTLLIIALSLCFLSRYALIFWAIMYAIYYFFKIDKKEAIKIFIGTAILSALIMWFFEGFENLDVFIGLKDNYIEALPENKWKYRPLINDGLGIAKFFTYESLSTLHSLHFYSAIIIPLFLLMIGFKNKTIINHRLFGWASLKLSLVFFFNLLIIPYAYLFYSSTILSLLFLVDYLNKQSNVEE